MGVYLSEPNVTKNTKLGSNQHLSFVSVEMQGINWLSVGWRKTMEDATVHILDLGDGNSLFAVFDGHGGYEVSALARNIFGDILINLPSYKSQNYELALDQTFKKVDEHILSADGQKQLRKIQSSAIGGQNSNEGGQFIGNSVGCTANVLLITPKTYIAANAGDSRSSLCRNGKAIDLSNDHKPQSPIEQERIKRAGGVIQMGRVNGGLNLTRSFGDFDYKQNKGLQYNQQMITCKPDLKTVERQKQDRFIVMGCDGIWEKYVENSQGLIELIKEGLDSKKEIQKLMQDLLDTLLAKDTSAGIGCDNMSAILIVFQ